MMTPIEASKFCIKTAGYGIRLNVVQAIQEDARKDLLEENKQLREQLEIHNVKEMCRGCGKGWNPSLVESGYCIFCICNEYKNKAESFEAQLIEEVNRER